MILWIERFILYDEKSIQRIYCCKEIFTAYYEMQLIIEVEPSMLLLLLLVLFSNRQNSKLEREIFLLLILVLFFNRLKSDLEKQEIN